MKKRNLIFILDIIIVFLSLFLFFQGSFVSLTRLLYSYWIFSTIIFIVIFLYLLYKKNLILKKRVFYIVPSILILFLCLYYSYSNFSFIITKNESYLNAHGSLLMTGIFFAIFGIGQLLMNVVFVASENTDRFSKVALSIYNIARDLIILFLFLAVITY